MGKYVVQWNYRSSLGGPFLKDDVVELDEARAGDINRDSPGVLNPLPASPNPKRIRGGAELKPVDPETIQARMVKHGETHGRKPGETMTSANFGAVAAKEE